MLKIGKYNTLTISRMVDFGAYLTDGAGHEVLLPNRYVTPEMHTGDSLEVFVYTDSDDRPVATTDTPFATADEFAFLQVRDVNQVGAFLDWGLPKDLLVPYSQQKSRMNAGGIYPVYIYLDKTSGRVVGSAKIEKFVGNVYPDYRPGDKVHALVLEHTPIGYRTIVDNRHWGMIYNNEIEHPLEIQQTVDCTVKNVRDDGKIDLAVAGRAAQATDRLSKQIINELLLAGGTLPLADSSSPEEIREAFGCSKKDFKKALGHLYKNGKILIGRDEISLA
ncbi:MAG: GntR family transcriptional regulator [Muribaculaceae bacterium]|nr:GntR family transcriptional regulator [Muribaculaceae bacterium]